MFSQLYHVLDRKHGFKDSSGRHEHLFVRELDGKSNLINYPFAAALLAERREEHGRFSWSMVVAVGSLILSALAFYVSVSS